MLVALSLLAVLVLGVVLALSFVELRSQWFAFCFRTFSLPRLRACGLPYVGDVYKLLTPDNFYAEMYNPTGPYAKNMIDAIFRMDAPVVAVGRSIASTAGVVCICTPDGAKEFADQDSKILVKGGLWSCYGRYAVGYGMAYNEGEKWRVTRKALTSLFHFKTLKSYVPNLDELAEAAIGEFETIKAEPVHPQKIFGKFAISAVIGLIFDNIVDPEETAERYHRLEQAFGRFMGKYTQLGEIADIIPFQETRNVRKVRGELLEIAKTAIAKLREGDAFRTPDPETGRVGLLRTLLQAQESEPIITDELIVEEVTTFLFAGYDTTSQTLSHVMAHIAKYKDAQEKIRKEVEEVVGDQPFTLEMVEKLTVTRSAIEETLRFIGIAGPGRVALQDTEIAGYKIPKGTEVILFTDIVAKHRSAGWKYPEQWDLRNWQGDQDKRHTHGYVPFWAGQRNCIGRKFALQEATMVLAKIVRTFNVEPASDYYPVFLSVMSPNLDFKVRFVPRN